jgi:hypothetical protein
MCHNIADGFGMIQLMISVAELMVDEATPRPEHCSSLE